MSDLWRNHNFATSPTKSTYISKVCTVKRENTITYSGCNTVRNFLKKKKKSSFGFATWSNFFFFPFQPSMSVKLFTWSGLFEPCSGKCIVSDEILCKLIFNFFFYYYFISVWHLWLYGILFDGSSFKGWKKKMYLPCIQEDVNETSDPFFQNCDFCRPPNILGNWSIHHSMFSCATILRVPDIHL